MNNIEKIALTLLIVLAAFIGGLYLITFIFIAYLCVIDGGTDKWCALGIMAAFLILSFNGLGGSRDE